MQLLTQQGSKEKAESSKKRKRKKKRSTAAVSVLLWFKWGHSLLVKQRDRSAGITGQLDGGLLTTWWRSCCQEVNSKPSGKGINHFTQLKKKEKKTQCTKTKCLFYNLAHPFPFQIPTHCEVTNTCQKVLGSWESGHLFVALKSLEGGTMT